MEGRAKIFEVSLPINLGFITRDWNRSRGTKQQQVCSTSLPFLSTRPVFGVIDRSDSHAILASLGSMLFSLSVLWQFPSPPYRGHPIKIWGYTRPIRIWLRIHYAQLPRKLALHPNAPIPRAGEAHGEEDVLLFRDGGPFTAYIPCVGIFWRRKSGLDIREIFFLIIFDCKHMANNRIRSPFLSSFFMRENRFD